MNIRRIAAATLIAGGLALGSTGIASADAAQTPPPTPPAATGSFSGSAGLKPDVDPAPVADPIVDAPDTTPGTGSAGLSIFEALLKLLAAGSSGAGTVTPAPDAGAGAA